MTDSQLACLAPAKLNLCLRVTGRRADGYHLLDSVVAFAGIGDHLTARPAADLRLSVDGPFAAGLSGADNLVLRAARAMREALDAPGASIQLDKRLPVAAGIGGGSADAAATIRLLERLWDRRLAEPARTELALSLGADVPVCLAGVPCRMRGIGEILSPLPALPALWAVLVNPGVAVPTAEVFGRLSPTDCAAPDMPEDFPDARALCDWLEAIGNDLAAPAETLAPQIGRVLAALSSCEGVLLAQMSGSGATCFGLCAEARAAEAAARMIRLSHPGWWVTATPLKGAAL